MEALYSIQCTVTTTRTLMRAWRGKRCCLYSLVVWRVQKDDGWVIQDLFMTLVSALK